MWRTWSEFWLWHQCWMKESIIFIFDFWRFTRCIQRNSVISYFPSDDIFQSVYSCHSSKYSMQQYAPLKYVVQRISQWSHCVIEWPVFHRMLELECHCNCTKVESLLTDDRQRMNIMALAFNENILMLSEGLDRTFSCFEIRTDLRGESVSIYTMPITLFNEQH